jgi:hypothetical protein
VSHRFSLTGSVGGRIQTFGRKKGNAKLDFQAGLASAESLSGVMQTPTEYISLAQFFDESIADADS